MIRPKNTQIVTDLDIKTKFQYAGAEYATFGNMDEDNIVVVDPITLEYQGKPKTDVEYPMLRSGVNVKDCSFYPNAMVTKKVDGLMKEFAGMTGTRDSYDVTMLVRSSDLGANVESLAAKRGLSMRASKPKPQKSADVVSLFPAAE